LGTFSPYGNALDISQLVLRYSHIIITTTFFAVYTVGRMSYTNSHMSNCFENNDVREKLKQNFDSCEEVVYSLLFDKQELETIIFSFLY
jgi:hypothetical protein